VDEIGKNSVSPSTTPITAAFNNNIRSTNAPRKIWGDYRDIRAPLSAHAAIHAFHAAQSAFHRIPLFTRSDWIDISPHHSAPIPNAAP
jgi:hypothetical protein